MEDISALNAPLQPRAGEPQEKKTDQGAALLPADPSAAVQTEALPNSVRRGEHGKDCIKVAHWRHGAFLHPGDHDGPYEIDNVQYCGRCHAWMGTQIVVVGSVSDSVGEASPSPHRSDSAKDHPLKLASQPRATDPGHDQR